MLIFWVYTFLIITKRVGFIGSVMLQQIISNFYDKNIF